jgi:SMODS-associating 4TM effector domain
MPMIARAHSATLGGGRYPPILQAGDPSGPSREQITISSTRDGPGFTAEGLPAATSADMTVTPSKRPVAAGSSAHIKERQNEPPHLQRLLAYSYQYKNAQRWRRVRALGTFALAAAAPVIALLVPSSSDVLAAISAGWLVAGRTLLGWLEQRGKNEAAAIQELFDTELFYLPWNAALAGRRPAPEDVADAARHIKDDTPYRDWYSVDLGDTPWPGDVLLCQRQSMVWARRDHRAYGTAILIVGSAWFVAGLAIAIARDLTLASYLIKIFLPSAPAFLDTIELARAHWQQAASRRDAEYRIHDLWAAHQADPSAMPPSECREIQDAAYLLRRDSPRVPALFYKLRKQASATSTEAGTLELRSQSTRKP